jgi:hypothetical protein
MATQIARRLFTTEEYHRMVPAGILSADDRVELLDGEVVPMSPIGSRHAACVERTATVLRRLGRRAHVRTQNPIVLGRHSEPQPDVAVVKSRADFYWRRHPIPSEVFLVAEVLDSSHLYDRELKLPLYAAAGIREVWLVDLTNDRIEVYRHPTLRGYPEPRILQGTERIAPLAFPRTGFHVSEFLG